MTAAMGAKDGEKFATEHPRERRVEDEARLAGVPIRQRMPSVDRRVPWRSCEAASSQDWMWNWKSWPQEGPVTRSGVKTMMAATVHEGGLVRRIAVAYGMAVRRTPKR